MEMEKPLTGYFVTNDWRHPQSPTKMIMMNTQQWMPNKAKSREIAKHATSMLDTKTKILEGCK